MPQPTPNAQYHWPSVANAAIAQTLRGLVRPWTVAAVTSFEDELGAQYAASLPPGVYDRSVEYGYLVGATILNWAAEDGYATLNNCPYSPVPGEGYWVPTPPGNLPPLQPCWGQLRAFTLNNNDECLPVAHATYSTDTSSAFYHQAAECFNAAPNCTPDDSATVYFWADGPIATGTPGGHSIKILTQVLTRDHHNLETAAEAYARVSMAVADAFISCWRAKYIHNLLRPITYIRSEIGPNWNCMITTPNFPEYTSGHSVQSGAAAQVLTSMFGAGYSFVDSTHYPTWTPRSFSSFDDFANEAAMSRLFGGIHYRDAIVFGLDQGECVGVRVAALPLRPNS